MFFKKGEKNSKSTTFLPQFYVNEISLKAINYIPSPLGKPNQEAILEEMMFNQLDTTDYN